MDAKSPALQDATLTERPNLELDNVLESALKDFTEEKNAKTDKASEASGSKDVAAEVKKDVDNLSEEEKKKKAENGEVRALEEVLADVLKVSDRPNRLDNDPLEELRKVLDSFDVGDNGGVIELGKILWEQFISPDMRCHVILPILKNLPIWLNDNAAKLSEDEFNTCTNQLKMLQDITAEMTQRGRNLFRENSNRAFDLMMQFQDCITAFPPDFVAYMKKRPEAAYTDTNSCATS